MGPTWVLSAPDGPHVGPINLSIRDIMYMGMYLSWDYTVAHDMCRQTVHICLALPWIVTNHFYPYPSVSFPGSMGGIWLPQWNNSEQYETLGADNITITKQNKTVCLFHGNDLPYVTFEVTLSRTIQQKNHSPPPPPLPHIPTYESPVELLFLCISFLSSKHQNWH